MQAQINRIADKLRKDDGISGAMDYTEQISWILFLKFLDEYEQTQELEAKLSGKEYKSLIDKKYQRHRRAVPKKNGKIDSMVSMTGDDLKDFVNKDLFPYLKAFRHPDADYHSMKYKIGEIFFYVDNKIESGHTLREIFDIIDKLNFQQQDDIFEMSKIYEDILHNMGSGGGTSGEFYTPRSVIKAMVDCLDPRIGETVYDGATGSCGFLIECFHHLKPLAKTSDDLHWLTHDALWGNEKTPIAYIMGVMNMILHGIENPNINKKNTLTDDIRGFEEKERFNIIIANPPFGGKEKEQIQVNFPIKSGDTEHLFMQHFNKKLKRQGRAAIIVPEGVLFKTSKAYQDLKKELFEENDVHSIVSLPSGVFLPYAGVKTNIIFFEKGKPTEKIRYYELNLDRKLTKNKPITSEDMQDMVISFQDKRIGENSRFIDIADIRDYDISAKNPAKIKDIIHVAPREILQKIAASNTEIQTLTQKLNKMIK